MRDAAYLVREASDPGKEEEMYVYLPALQKVRRITGAMKDSSLFGTDLSYSGPKRSRTCPRPGSRPTRNWWSPRAPPRSPPASPAGSWT